MGLDIYFDRVKRTEVDYYRKVNFLVKFFEEKGFDGENLSDFYVTRDNIIDLISRCEEVLKDHSKAEELLPTIAGFFFGSIVYNESYFRDVEYVLKNCESKLLPVFDELEDDESLVFRIWY